MGMHGNAVTRLRRSRNMTQARLAQACGVSTRTIKRAERGEALSDETVLALCSVLGCAAPDLAVCASPVSEATQAEGGHGSAVSSAIGWGVVLAMSLNLVGFRLAQTIPGSSDDGWTRYVTVAMVAMAALAGMAVQAVMLAWKSPRMGNKLPSWMRLGPFPVALLSALVTPFPAMGIGLAMAEGHASPSMPAVLAAVVMPPLGVVAGVLGADPGRIPAAAIIRAGSPHLTALAILVQAVCAACGDPGTAAAGALLLFPVMLFAPGLTQGAAFAGIALACLPALQRVYVEGLLPPAPLVHDLATYCCLMAADVVAVGLLARPRLRRASSPG